MTTEIKYVGALPSGVIQCPISGRSYAFTRNNICSVPEEIAVAVALQSPGDWDTSPVIKKIIESKAENPATPAEVEPLNEQENG